jgi:hypothetical protein
VNIGSIGTPVTITVVPAQATARANVARAEGGSPDLYLTARTTSGVSSVAANRWNSQVH